MKAGLGFVRTFAFPAALIVALAGCAGAGVKTGEYIDDSAITTKVKTALLNDKDVHDSMNINVETLKGRVQLAGYVKTPDERQRAEGVARSVAGVKSVSNKIEVR